MKKFLTMLAATLALSMGIAGAQDFSGGVCTGTHKYLSPSYTASYCAIYGPGGTYDQTYGKGGLYCIQYGYNC